MINTYNESSLHKKLKNYYAEIYNGKTEVELNGFFCDVVTDNEIYEIQTSNLSLLSTKIQRLIQDYCITIIFPIGENTFIQWKSQNNEILSQRKSPKKENEYRIFKEITKLLPFLNNPNFRIILLKTDIMESRIKTDSPIQLQNKSRHWKKSWYKDDKDLLNINSEIIFDSSMAYINLIRQIVKEKAFSLKQLKNNTAISKYAGYIIWILKKLDAIEETRKKGNEKFYRLIK